MGFVGIYRAVYDYAPQATGELSIAEGDILYILNKQGEEGWWKAKKKAGNDDEDEPIGLVPNNYVEEAPKLGQARALYEYTRQTDEELSFSEDAVLEIFDTSDPDWILAGLDGDYGFVPSNYIDPADDHDTPASPTPVAPAAPAAPALPARPPSIAQEPQSPVHTPQTPTGPAAALAGVIHGRSMASPTESSPPRQPARRDSQFDDYHHASDDEPVTSPALPSRPRPGSQPQPRHVDFAIQEEDTSTEPDRTPGGFHMYNISEMVSVMGKRKKMPTTLGINLRTGVILIAPERAQDGPSQEWTADRMTHYSREGKHVFMELVRPSKSIDFHAGAKDTADEIVEALGELAGAVRAEGLREVIMAGSKASLKKGQILYDFMAQGEDEVTVAAGDEVIIVDDSRSEEWWQVRRLKNGKEGVVPSSYIEITGTISPPPGGSGISSVQSTVEQNRLEDLRLTKEALKASKEPQQVGPGMTLPQRGSSLTASESGNNSVQQRGRRENGRGDGSSQGNGRSKPDPSKTRTWTDRSGTFSVQAQFLGLNNGKIHLHKMHGVKIAVPLAKMSRQDVEYLENITGMTLHEDKSRIDTKKTKPSERPQAESGATAQKDQKPEYDWFQFFLSCEVAVGLCERYAQAFIKDSMDESVLPDVDAKILRTLGLREGDIIKVMRVLDAKFGRQRGNTDGDGGLFSGPGGALRNNTRKGRPAPAVQTSDVVDASAFAAKDKTGSTDGSSKPPTPPSPARQPANDTKRTTETSGGGTGGFDDDAWDVKPSKQPQPQPSSAPSPPVSTPVTSAPPAQVLTGSMKELSLLSEPLQPTKTAEQPQPQQQPQPQSQPLAVGAGQSQGASGVASQAKPGATPSFFSALPPQQPAAMEPVATGMRQRPLPPQTSPLQGSLMPPPQRPLSAPQSAQPSAFAAPGLMPQLTGSIQSQVAPPGQSLHDFSQARLQQQQYGAHMQQAAYTGFPGGQPQGIASFPTGAPGQLMQPMMTGITSQGPFADPGRPAQFSPVQVQPTGFQQQPYGNMLAQFGQQPPGSINNYLPPALEPQRTGAPNLQPQPTGPLGFNQPPPQQPMQPLQPQQTGPPPPVRFGVTAEAKRLAPQPTGRRANLAQATPQNPFGF